MNSYAGIMETWQVALIGQRARRLGLRGPDLEDALQEVVWALLDFRFDPAKANGACEATVLTAVIDKQLAMLCRRQRRYRQRLQRLQQGQVGEEEYCQDNELACDVQAALAQLSPVQRQLCAGLSEGRSLQEMAALWGLGWSRVRREIYLIRRFFESLGLGWEPAPTDEVAA